MPPKAKKPEPSKKQQQEKKQKVIEVQSCRSYVLINFSQNWFVCNKFVLFYTNYISIQDRTFGLKNKKGAKAQKFIQQVQKSVQNANKKVIRLSKFIFFHMKF